MVLQNNYQHGIELETKIEEASKTSCSEDEDEQEQSPAITVQEHSIAGQEQTIAIALSGTERSSSFSAAKR